MSEQSVTAPSLRGKKERGEAIAVLTAYDYRTARLMDESGVDVILVGDSVGNAVMGLPDTLAVTMDDMLHHTAMVARGADRARLPGRPERRVRGRAPHARAPATRRLR